MNGYYKHNGKLFKKSSFSPSIRWDDRCVGVCIQGSSVMVMNTKKRSPIIEFTLEEWDAFVKGVKAGEFDIGRR